METIVAALVNTLASCLWMHLLTGGSGVIGRTATVAATPAPTAAEADAEAYKAGTMTFEQFGVRMAARL